MNDAWPRCWGLLLLLVGFGGLMAWALTGPLDAGACAVGTVVFAGNHKAVQTKVLGKITAILVKGGAAVALLDCFLNVPATAMP